MIPNSFLPNSNKRAETGAANYKAGLFAELQASVYLLLRGYRPIGRRVKTPVGEIDLVVKRGSVLAFVEIKTRLSQDDALSSISAKQRQRIIRAAQYFLQRHPDFQNLQPRFDCVCLAPGFRAIHIQNAWPAE